MLTNLIHAACSRQRESIVKQTTITVPDIGGAEGAEVVEVLVSIGDTVALEQSLIVLESDKASMEIPASCAGEVVDIKVAVGDELSEGDAIVIVAAVEAAADLEASADPAAINPETEQQLSTPQESESVPPRSAPVTSTSSPPSTGVVAGVSQVASTSMTDTPARSVSNGDAASDQSSVYAGPAVRKLAREFGIRLTDVSGSGPKGRVTKADLHRFVQQTLDSTMGASVVSGTGIPVMPEIDFSQFGEIDAQPRSRLEKLTASNMSRAWLTIPHVTQFDDADITELEAFRHSLKAEAEQRNTRITPLPFLLKACAVALNANPQLKTSLADGGDTLVHKQFCHIGMAVDTPAGLLVPVIRDVDRKSIWELSEEVSELAALARDKKLKPAQMQGGVFSISSLGGIGGRGFTPIVNAPEVAILGVSKASVQPVWDGSHFAPKTLLPLSLSYDHRVVNGGHAGRFLTELVGLLSDIRRLVL